MVKKLIISLLLLSPFLLRSEEIVSPFNGKKIVVEELPSSYSFFVGGHYHGSSSNKSGFPAATLLANLDLLNQRNEIMMVSLGDLFIHAPRAVNYYKNYLFNRINYPLFNVVGNHDIEDIDYEGLFGNTYFTFDLNTERYVFLDTEMDDGYIEGDQLKMLKNALSSINGVKNVFVFAHRPIWAEDDEDLQGVFKENTSNGTNFSNEILSILKETDVNVYWFGGSLGGGAPASYFYHEKTDKLTYIATAIRDLPRDGILSVKISNGQVSFECISFTGQKLLSLEEYNLKFWRTKRPEEKFNWRLVPLYIYQMITHRYFWYGLIYTVLGGVSFLFVRKWWKKRKLA